MKNGDYYTELPTAKEAVIIILGIIALNLLLQYITSGFFLYELY